MTKKHPKRTPGKNAGKKTLRKFYKEIPSRINERRYASDARTSRTN
jgi:hypothetical protein